MLTINFNIEGLIKGELDETSMFLDDDTENKLNEIVAELEKVLQDKGMSQIGVEYDFFDEELDENLTPLSEGLIVTETWSTDKTDTVKQEKGRQYKKTE